jgi:uncharacterized protein (TIGR03086 family)
MDSRATANLYYDAWQHKAGDMSGVPLAEDFAFTGPVASFESAAGFRAMATQAGPAVRSFAVRHQFTDGDLVCSVIDWEMAPLPGTLTAAEILEIKDGTIVRGELIYDAEELRKAMAPKPFAELLDRSLRTVTELVGMIDKAAWAAPSPCADWTVRQAGNHLAGSLSVLVRIAEGESLPPAELDAERMAGIDLLGADPVAALSAIADRARVVFADPATLGRTFDQPVPGATGELVANIALLESLVHGWDVATGAGIDYRPDGDVVNAVQAFATMVVTDAQRAQGLFGPAVPTPAHAEPLTTLLGHLGRHAA